MLGGIPQQQLALRIGGEPASPECQMLIGFGFALHGPKPSPEWDWPPEGPGDKKSVYQLSRARG